MPLKISRWVFFVAVISILPLYLAYSDLLTADHPATLEQIIGHGELYVIVWVLVASAASELFGVGKTFNVFKVMAGALSLYLIVIAAHKFGMISEANALKAAIDPANVVRESIQLFLSAIVVSLGCLVISEL